MVKAFTYGKMAKSTKVILKMGRDMVMADIFILMETSSKVSFQIISKKAKENKEEIMAQYFKDITRMT